MKSDEGEIGLDEWTDPKRTRKVPAAWPVLVMATVLVVAVYAAITSAMGWDQSGSFGSVNQAQYHPSGWWGGFLEAWDHRQFFYTVIVFLLWAFAMWVGVEVGSLLFEPLVQSLFLVIFLPPTLLAGFAIARAIGLGARKSLLFGAFSGLSFVAVSQPWVFMQPDHVAVALVFFSIALFFGPNRTFWIVAGFLAGAVVGVKAPLVFVSLAALLLIATIAKASRVSEVGARIWYSILGGLLGLLAYGVVLLVHPFQLEDLRLFPAYQGSLNLGLQDRFGVFWSNVANHHWHVPILVVFVTIVALASLKYLLSTASSPLASKTSLGVGLVLAAALAVASLAILVQAQPYGYHLVAFMPLILTTLVYFSRHGLLTTPPPRVFGTPGLIAAALAVVLIVSVPFDTDRPLSWLSYSDSRNSARDREVRENAHMAKSCSGQILYLSAAHLAYRWPGDSLLRQTYPLDIQRKGESLVGAERRTNALNTILSEPPDCILWQDNWLNSSDRPWFEGVEEMIKTYYRPSGEFPGLWVRVNTL